MLRTKRSCWCCSLSSFSLFSATAFCNASSSFPRFLSLLSASRFSASPVLTESISCSLSRNACFCFNVAASTSMRTISLSLPVPSFPLSSSRHKFASSASSNTSRRRRLRPTPWSSSLILLSNLPLTSRSIASCASLVFNFTLFAISAFLSFSLSALSQAKISLDSLRFAEARLTVSYKSNETIA